MEDEGALLNGRSAAVEEESGSRAILADGVARRSSAEQRVVGMGGRRVEVESPVASCLLVDLQGVRRLGEERCAPEMGSHKRRGSSSAERIDELGTSVGRLRRDELDGSVAARRASSSVIADSGELSRAGAIPGDMRGMLTSSLVLELDEHPVHGRDGRRGLSMVDEKGSSSGVGRREIEGLDGADRRGSVVVGRAVEASGVARCVSSLGEADLGELGATIGGSDVRGSLASSVVLEADEYPLAVQGVDDRRAVFVCELGLGESTMENRDDRAQGYRGLRWSSEGGLVDGFVMAGFDEHGSNLDKTVGLIPEFGAVVVGGDEGVETGPGLSGELSMRDRLAAASKSVAEEKFDESSSSSGSSSSGSGSSSSSESGSVSSSSETGDSVVGKEREVVDDHAASRIVGSLSDPTSSCSSDEEPALGSLGEAGVEDIIVDGGVELERRPDEGGITGTVVDERVGVSGGGDEDVVASDECEGVSAGEFSEVKGESFDFSYPSYADYSSTVDLVDGEMEQKIKKPRKKSCRMGPLLDHPRDSKSSTVMASRLEWIKASCCTEGAVEVRLPGSDERPWTVPDGWVCLYDFWFLEYHLWFPLPRLLLAYCDERRIALSQLTPGSIRNVVGALVLAAECGVHMSLYFLEEIIKITPGETYGTFYLSMKSGRCFVKEERRKTFDWIRRFFYVRITPSSVSDMSRPLMTSWNPYHDRHTVGVPFAPGYKECLAYVESIGIQNWKLVDRTRVLRCVAFISSATWEVRSRMDFSEFPSLSGCFAGGSVTDVAAAVGDGAGASVGVGASASAPGVVVGLASAPASFAQSADRRREGRGASEKSVTAGGKKGGDPKKRPSDGSLAREASSSKLRKVAVTTKDVPPPSGAPLVGGVSVVDGGPPADGGEVVFQPFECAFGGTVEDCGELFKKLRMVGDDEGCPLDTSERSEWYIKYARHTTIAAKYVNRLVSSQDAELKVVAAELAKANGKLAAAKGGADRTGEITAWRKKYEAERKVSFAAQEEVKALTTRMVVDAERAKKRQAMEEERYQKGKEMLRKRYDRAIARHDDVLATCNSRVDKVRRFVDDQKVVRQAMYGVNQIHGVLDAVKVWRSEGIKIPESKVKHLEGELDVRTRAASLVIPVAFEEKELALIPSFDFSVPLDPVPPSLTEGVEEAALAREKEEARRRSDVDRRRSSDREGTRRDGGVPSRS
ncbi:hypothetical protein N665_1401s0017 [Sinapis alba]|nr:hypothetical protein N665_1401s0017 [Sinapis alba]